MLRRNRWEPDDDGATVGATLSRLAAEIDALAGDVPPEVRAFRAALDRPAPLANLHAEQARLLAYVEARPGLAPAPPPPDHTERVTVDGHDFRVGRRGRTYDFDWLTGPHEYGFAISAPTTLTRAEMEQHIRDFLRDINPETGYLD